MGCGEMIVAVLLSVVSGVPLYFVAESGLLLFSAAAVLVIGILVAVVISGSAGNDTFYFQIALMMNLLMVGFMIKERLGLGYWEGLPITLSMVVLAYLLGYRLPRWWGSRYKVTGSD
ncbi:MAG: hypothetical protein M3Q29_14050, partial [Chloroflexota bacterium]|nr:hypothetical protein [Chloroflexota bacterium]